MAPEPATSCVMCGAVRWIPSPMGTGWVCGICYPEDAEAEAVDPATLDAGRCTRCQLPLPAGHGSVLCAECVHTAPAASQAEAEADADAIPF